MVTHDERLECTSNGTGWVKDFSYAQLLKLDFSGEWNHGHRGPSRIPAMEEVFELIRPTGMAINIELKTSLIHYRGIEHRILDMAARYGMEERVIYSSFHRLTLEKLRLLNPDAKVGLLYAETFPNMPALAKRFGIQALHPAYYHILAPRFMDDCRDNGLDVNVWTVNTEEQIRLSLRAGVNAIITDYPDQVKRIAGEMGFV